MSCMYETKTNKVKRGHQATKPFFYNFLGSESAQIQSVKLLQNMVSNRTPYLPSYPLYTVYICTVYLFTQGRGGGLNQRGQQFTKLGRKYHMSECTSGL